MKSQYFFKALSDQTRLRIFRILAHSNLILRFRTIGHVNVAELSDILQRPQYAISRGLAELKKADLVMETQQGQMVYYRLNSEIPGVAELGQWVLDYCLCQTCSPELCNNDGSTKPGADPCTYDLERLKWRLTLGTLNTRALTYRPKETGGLGVNLPSSLQPEPVRVLFFCVHNSARSQLAEAYVHLHGQDRFIAESAGLEAGTLNPLVVQVLLEQGIDIRSKQPQALQQVFRSGKTYDWVIGVCDPVAEKNCPVFPGPVNRLSWPFPDPRSFEGSYEQRLQQTRELARNIEERVLEFIAYSKKEHSA